MCTVCRQSVGSCRQSVGSLSTKCRQFVGKFRHFCRQTADTLSTEIRQIRRGHEPARNEGVQTGSVYMTYTNVDPRFTLTQTRGCLDPHKGSHCDTTSKSRQNLQKFDKMSTKCRQNVDRMPKISANADSLRQIFQSRIDAKCRWSINTYQHLMYVSVVWIPLTATSPTGAICGIWVTSILVEYTSQAEYRRCCC